MFPFSAFNEYLTRKTLIQFMRLVADYPGKYRDFVPQKNFFLAIQFLTLKKFSAA